MPITALVCLAAMTIHICLGGLVLWRAPHRPANRVFSILLFLFFFWSCGEFLLVQFGPRPLFYKLLFTPIILLPYVFALFTALFPRKLAHSAILAEPGRPALFFLPAAGLLTLLWANQLLAVCEPLSTGFLLSFGRFEFLAKGVAVGYLLLALKTLSQALRNVDSSLQEQRLRYAFAGLVLPAAAGSIFIALGRLVTEAPGTVYTFGIFPGLGLVMAALIGYAMLRYRLLDIDFIFGIGLVYTLLTAILAGVMELIQNLMQNLFDANNTLAMIISTLFIAAAFSPLKDLIVRLVDYLFGKHSFNSTMVMRHLLKQMRAARDQTDVLHRLLSELKPVLDFSAAAVVMQSGTIVTSPRAITSLPPLPDFWLPLDEIDAFIEAAQETPGKDTTVFQAWYDRNFRLVFPISGDKENKGALFLSPKINRLPYSPEERALIGSLCQEVPPIFDTLELIQSLVERDRDSRDLQWATEMYRHIRADESIRHFCGHEVRLFSSLAPRIKGDLIDCDEYPGGTGFIAICDAFHEGIQAALTLHIIFTGLRASEKGKRHSSIHAVLAKFNTPPLRSALTLLERTSQAEWTVSDAGNPSPLLLHPDKEPRILLKSGNPLGMDNALPVSQMTISLAPGEMLLCCTNGLTKAFGDEDGKALRTFIANYFITKSVDAKITGIKHDESEIALLHDTLQNALTALPGRSSFPDDITYVLIGNPSTSETPQKLQSIGQTIEDCVFALESRN